MRTISGLILSLVVLAGINAGAQSVRSVAAQGAAVSNSTLSIDRKITVRFEATPLHDALQAIAKQSGAQISYRQETLPSKHRVTMNVTDISARNVLKMVLKGTGVEMSVTSTGEVALYRNDAGKSQGIVTGKVTDSKSGRGIAGATVSMNGDTRGVVTDEGGFYRLIGLSSGTHTFSVRSVGYAKQTRSITVGDGATVTVDFKLEPSANVLDQVVVTGTVIASELKSVPNAITVITAKQIEERGITRIDQLFRGDVPGLFSLNLGGGALLDEVVMFSRGATALSNTSAGVTASIGGTTLTTFTNSIKTYIDGVELVDSRYMSQIDPKSIERIEILTGPQASTIYGSNAINGVMQIFTKRGGTSRPQAVINVMNGVVENNSNNRRAPNYETNINISGIEGRLSYNTGVSWNYIGSWIPAKQTQRFGVSGGGRIEIGKITTDASVRKGITRNSQNGDPLQLLVDLRATGFYQSDPSAGVLASRIQTLNSRTLGLSVGFRPLSWWSHEIILGNDLAATEALRAGISYSSSSDTALDVSPSISSRTSQRYNTTLQIPIFSLMGLNLVLGADHYRTTGTSWRAAPSVLTGSFSCLSSFCTRAKSGKNSGAFVQGQLSFFDALFFTYGIRADWNPNFGEQAKVKPGRYGVSYARDVGLISVKLRGSYGRSIRPPQDNLKLGQPESLPSIIALFGMHDTQLANPDLGPEYQQGGEGGLEFYIGDRGSLVITRYNGTVDNLISSVGTTGTVGPGVDSIPSLLPDNILDCGTPKSDGYCYRHQKQHLNVGSIRNQGWEFQGVINTGPFSTRGTYSWNKSRVIGVTPRYRAILTGEAFIPGSPFRYMPEHTWALGMTYTTGTSTVSLSVNGASMIYKGNTPLSVSTSTGFSRITTELIRMGLPSGYRSSSAGYATADVNAMYKLSRKLDLNFQIFNLTDHYQNDFDIRYGTIGRQTKLGARIRLN